MMTHTHGSRSGLSLLELLVVVAVVGVLVALVGFGVRGLLDRGRLTESLNAVEARIGEARRLAKRLDREVIFEISSDGGWQTVVDGSAREIPGQAVVTSGATSIAFDAPFGTYGGADDITIVLDVNGVTGSVVVTGVLARTVVLR